MHILLVNDDGIQAPGIRALSDACVARGHRVTVCAPHTERSASSHRITLAEPIYARETDYGSALVQGVVHFRHPGGLRAHRPVRAD